MKNGYRSITIAKETHDNLKKRAKEANCTIREYVECLVAKDKSVKAEKYSFADENVQSA